ncbi:MAG: ABC transporter ATP-binding protein [Acidimicrobiia bacterium]
MGGAHPVAAAVEVRNLVKTFGGPKGTVAIDDLTFDIEDGQFLVLLGPSGCGKTTTLRCLAGLETADAGQIGMRDEVVFDANRKVNRPPERRNIGMVFQSYALWPNMTVRQNLEYPLKARRLQEGLQHDWVGEIARVVECHELLHRYPGQLSGGQQQRVALARGLVSRPNLILFDEPLSNLDARLRKAVRSELHRLHRRLGFTAVYVTHDQEEAFALADQLMIMRNGRIEQSGTPYEIYRNPATDYVAEFVGMSNRFMIEPSATGWIIAGERLEDDHALVNRNSARHPFAIRLRPDDIQVLRTPTESRRADTVLAVTFVDASFAARSMDVVVDLAGTLVHAQVPSADSYATFASTEVGDRLWIGFRAADAVPFDLSGYRLDVDRTFAQSADATESGQPRQRPSLNS